MNQVVPGAVSGPNRFVVCTELAGEEVSLEQVERMARRYYWAGGFCAGQDVVEIACGTGQGLGYLRSLCRSLRAGDISPEMVRRAKEIYAQFDITIQELDAGKLPFADASADIVILFEAIYYLKNPEDFIAECRRTLRPGGKILLATANPDLFDFVRSPFSFRYFGAADFPAFFDALGFNVRMYGDTPLARVRLRQKLLRPIKALATRLNIIPGSMRSKRLLKRLFFGGMTMMPSQINAETAPWIDPVGLPAGTPDRHHKVLFCEASLRPAPRP